MVVIIAVGIKIKARYIRRDFFDISMNMRKLMILLSVMG